MKMHRMKNYRTGSLLRTGKRIAIIAFLVLLLTTASTLLTTSLTPLTTASTLLVTTALASEPAPASKSALASDSPTASEPALSSEPAPASGSALASDSALASEPAPALSQKPSFTQFLEDSWIFVILFICVVFAVILILLRQKLKAERKANEQQRLLEEAEEIKDLKQTISSLLDNMPGMSFTKDAGSGVYLACNQAFADYAKKASPDDVTGLTDAQIFDAETAAHFEKDDRLALSMDKPYIFYEDVLDGAGQQRQFQTTKLKYTDFSGRECILGISQDVTDMVRIPRESAETKEAYESARSVGILYTHIAKTLARDYTDMFYVNLDTEEFIEYRRTDENSALSETRRGWHFFSDCKKELSASVCPDDRDAFLEAMDRRTLMKALERKNTFMITYRQIGDNEPFYVSLKVSLMEDDEHFIIVGITNVDAQMRDTIAKNMALADALASAEEANKEKTSFLSGMSHEIRTPMNAIIGLSSLALRDESLSAQTRDYLRKMGDSAGDLLRLIDDILEMSRIESGSMVLNPEPFSLTSMLEQINLMLTSQCEKKGISYDFQLLNLVDTSYIGDEAKLKDVLINILSDSATYTKTSGSIRLTVEKTEKYQDLTTLRFGIRCIGIDQDHISRIIEALSQNAENSAFRYNSTGLETAITKQIVEMMNGSIDIECKKDSECYTMVTVTLKNCDQPASDQNTVLNPHALYVLVVDDDPIAAEHTRLVLKEAGIRSDCCTSGEEALQMIELQHASHTPYNLVLMDWNMPGMSGKEASEKIQEQYGQETTVIVLTAYNWDDIREDAHHGGVNNFLTKPLDADNILRDFERIARRNDLDLFMEKPRASLAGRRILLAEDVEINAQIIIDLLNMEQIETDHAMNGKTALEMYEKSPEDTYAAILMDMRMPQMDGPEATRAIRALDRKDAKKIPIIALTANAFDADVQLALHSGMNGCLRKPVDLDELTQLLGELIHDAEK